jgi:UrcA family protein
MKTITRNSKNFLAAVAAVCLASVTISAHADEAANGVPTHTVRYSDLDINTRAGATVLYARIRIAAQQVCGDADSQQLVVSAAVRGCVNRAIYTSVRSVNSPKLTSVYNSQVGSTQQLINLASER